MKLVNALRDVLPFLVLASALSAFPAARAGGGDAGRGADLFRQNCAPCHSAEAGQNGVGPSLFAVVGRPAATSPDFSYSNAMKTSGIIWTPEKLMAYLKAPRRYVPGVKMLFPGLDDTTDRENVVAYLGTLQDTSVDKVASPGATASSIAN